MLFEGRSGPVRKQFRPWLAAALFAACAGAQSIPVGWKVVKARYTNQIPDEWEKAAKAAGPPGSCQIAVPDDWKASPFVIGEVEAPSSSYLHPFDVRVQADVPGPTFAQQVQVIKGNDKSFHVTGQAVIEDSASRYWTTQNPAAGTTEWDVTVPGRPNCQATLHFPESAASQATAKKIMATLSPAK